MRRERGEGHADFRRFSRLGRRGPTDQATQQLLDTAVQESTTYEEFRGALTEEVDTLARSTPISEKHQLDQQSVGTFSGRESAIPNHVINLLRKLSEVKVLNVTDDRRPIGREEAQRLLNLKMQRGGQEPLNKIQAMVSALLGVRIDAFVGQQLTRSREPLAELDVDDFVVQVNGSGIKEALRLLLDIEFQTPNLLLVEEPEIHLHPALETSMMRYLKEVSRDRQVFITTHSTNFLDTTDMKNIYLVSKTDSTFVQLLDQREVEEQVPLELGIRLSSLFIYDRLVFVESQTDEDIVRAWASTIDVNLNQSNVGFIHMGGARNLSYFAASSTLSFLAKRRVKMWFLIDRDEKDEHDITAIRERLGHDAVPLVLNKREIENYLIHPRILADQISLKLTANRSRDRNEPDIEDIRVAIDKSAENLKKMTIFKRVTKRLCRPLYPNRSRVLEDLDGKTVEEKTIEEIEALEAKVDELKSTIADEIERQSQEVETLWNERPQDIVPGDLLIDMVYKNYGVRFHKERGDGVNIARMMTKSEIGPELEELINSIGN